MKLETDLQSPFAGIAPDELDDPLGIVLDLCDFDSLFGTRDHIFELYMLAMASEDWHTDSPRDKGSRMYRLKLMIRMVEVIYLLNHLHKTDQLYKYVRDRK